MDGLLVLAEDSQLFACNVSVLRQVFPHHFANARDNRTHDLNSARFISHFICMSNRAFCNLVDEEDNIRYPALIRLVHWCETLYKNMVLFVSDESEQLKAAFVHPKVIV